LGLAEILVLEVEAYNIKVMTIFLGQVATKCGRDLITVIMSKTKEECSILMTS
jgi:hypothetical protein